ncbi:hypothetical protein Ae201684P_000678 [Aphanomyces euteiches]|uniref:Neutral ceramidase n=1 Tax=Aphanomyces euteiches TaxID=100861 RepID=A0A6G0XR73_9STRA|nr:hypothetical protein Ae201684_002229 [Aphanomyces euteiches]KAH9087267.1 hypothetical protein Ae201684P_000678 [Aphanomyces euteiches]
MRIGAAMYDVTGPAAEVGMFGYAQAHQATSGIHMRLRSRAFVFHDDQDKYFAFVSIDTGCITETVTQAVIARLQEQEPVVPRNTFQLENVLLSATHTHCAPGGLSEFPIYSMHPPLKGFDAQNFECVVTGVVKSIVRAFRNLQPGTIRVARGDCLGASINRSVDAYNANPEEERKQYAHDTDKEMTLWRLDGDDGYPIGMINWFAVHPTSMGSWFTLITGDNKGYASHVFEREQGTVHLMDRPRCFVAAFAQSNEGDVSPNIFGPRNHANEHHDLERMEIVANAQLDTARRLYEEAASAPPVAGGLRFVHQYVDYNSIELEDKWHMHKECPKMTSSGCIGVSMLSGTFFDGRGVHGIPEGLQWGDKSWFTLMPQTQSMQMEKPIIFPTASYGMSPSVLPLQLITIADSLAIAALPFETTTMAGRRLRKSIASALNVDHVILAGLSNAYCGYMTTREEYAIQRYEGASTHFGPNQLVATQQQFERLAKALRSATPPETLLPPQKVSTSNWHTPVIQDTVPSPVANFGMIAKDVQGSKYTWGATVQAVFYGGHPKNDLRTQGTFLEIQRWRPDGRGGGVWVLFADDGDEHTFYHWKRSGLAGSLVTIVWHIPKTTPPGQYRIKHNGNYKLKWNSKDVVSYSGTSRAFSVSDGDEKKQAGLSIQIPGSTGHSIIEDGGWSPDGKKRDFIGRWPACTLRRLKNV